ncbi:hypothetical protein JW796_01680 [Candidatus Dojkabacteria bacterium]|nr:hypothetical protein [Candidatus Dojkabacteria bacterium]
MNDTSSFEKAEKPNVNLSLNKENNYIKYCNDIIDFFGSGVDNYFSVLEDS